MSAAKPGLFALGDGALAFAGYDTGRTWNGFSVPMFTRDVVDRLIKVWFDPAVFDSDYTVAFNARGDLVCTHKDSGGAPDDVNLVTAEWTLTTDGGMLLYTMEMGLCFEPVAAEDASEIVRHVHRPDPTEHGDCAVCAADMVSP